MRKFKLSLGLKISVIAALLGMGLLLLGIFFQVLFFIGMFALLFRNLLRFLNPKKKNFIFKKRIFKEAHEPKEKILRTIYIS